VLSIGRVDKVKYLGTYLVCNSGLSDLSNNIRKFCSQVNNVLAVLGKYSQEMSTLHLVKTHCLPTLLYGVETWSLNDASIHKAGVAWNNSLDIHCVSKKVPTFKLSVTLSNLKRFSQFLHCSKVYKMCYKTHIPGNITHFASSMLLHYLGKLNIQIFCKY